MQSAHKLVYSPDDLATNLGVQRGTIYRWRKSGKLPEGFLLSPSNRRWHVRELAQPSDKFATAFSHYCFAGSIQPSKPKDGFDESK